MRVDEPPEQPRGEGIVDAPSTSNPVGATLEGRPPADPNSLTAPVEHGPAALKFCFACAASIDARAEICPRCGVRQPYQAGMPTAPNQAASGDAVTRSGKSKMAASLIAIFLGGLGIHKFYLGDTKLGVIYLIFCWTLVPAVVGFVEGIVWLTQSNEQWLAKYGAV